ncbi:DUF2061 domain-containing protein [Pedomonas mirosovicensis]|uniref:DUF2061 domain-containing protein n=1 Tax=Pedomonas mirosovicensis TaxID=2908641 RepID=UPI002169ECBA|nr:DUF2061 domain-containing protein [Pedomonas mirosovicensis]MCH8684353.1 DUF2061 domain-containing protein [Pedomonas mirosovicensis]
MKRDLAKTLSFLMLHFMVGFSVAYAFTGQIGVSSAIALVEPMANAVVFFFHERAWRRAGVRADSRSDSGGTLAFHC